MQLVNVKIFLNKGYDYQYDELPTKIVDSELWCESPISGYTLMNKLLEGKNVTGRCRVIYYLPFKDDRPSMESFLVVYGKVYMN